MKYLTLFLLVGILGGCTSNYFGVNTHFRLDGTDPFIIGSIKEIKTVCIYTCAQGGHTLESECIFQIGDTIKLCK